MSKLEQGIDKNGNFDQDFRKPDWFDQKLFDEGRQFANKYNFACSMSSLTSLVLGLSFERLLEVLVYTNFSDTKEKSFWRYFDTGMHIRTWRETDVFEPGSAGNKSIRRIRQIHKVVRSRATEHFGHNKVYLSQTDLALTLIGFVGPILGQPDLFGVEEKDREMAGFIHMWRVLGYLHGIEDEYNPFEINDPLKTRISLFNALQETLIPNLHKPPKMFLPMTSAICAWAGPLNSFFSFLNSGLRRYKAGCIEYGIKIQFDEKTVTLLDEVEKMYQCKTFREKFSYYWLKFIFWLYSYPIGRWAWHSMQERLVRLIQLRKRPEAAKFQ